LIKIDKDYIEYEDNIAIYNEEDFIPNNLEYKDNIMESNYEIIIKNQMFVGIVYLDEITIQSILEEKILKDNAEGLSSLKIAIETQNIFGAIGELEKLNLENPNYKLLNNFYKLKKSVPILEKEKKELLDYSKNLGLYKSQILYKGNFIDNLKKIVNLPKILKNEIIIKKHQKILNNLLFKNNLDENEKILISKSRNFLSNKNIILPKDFNVIEISNILNEDNFSDFKNKKINLSNKSSNNNISNILLNYEIDIKNKKNDNKDLKNIER